MLGVAGGELIIPTIVLLYGLDIKLAGSLSLAISIPTIIVGIARYNKTNQIGELKMEISFIVAMCAGSISDIAGSYLLRYLASSFLHVFLGAILLVLRRSKSLRVIMHSRNLLKLSRLRSSTHHQLIQGQIKTFIN